MRYRGRMTVAPETAAARGAAEPHDTLIGTLIAGRYRVLGLLGRGSMGAVYEVEELGSGRHAAMKTVGQEVRDNPEVAARLVREAKAMSLFEHRNIVELFDVVAAGGAACVVTELVRGVSLRDVMADGYVEPRRALAIVRQVLEALDHAHARGVVHRDIKPENIMLADGGHPDRDEDLVKILDFGVAKLVDDTRALLGEGKLTRTGHEVFGAPLYVAPEPVLGRPVDARTDLYSVGVVLFELLAGRPPFDDPDPLVLLRLHASAKAPTLRERAPERAFTPELEYVVAEALAKKPELRFASAADMITALDAAARSIEPEPAVAAPPFAAPPFAAPPFAAPPFAAPPGAAGAPLAAPSAAAARPSAPVLAGPPLPGLPLEAALRSPSGDTYPTAVSPPPAGMIEQPAAPGGTLPVPLPAPLAPVPAGAPAAAGRPLSPQTRRRVLWAAGGTVAAVIAIACIAALAGGGGPAKGAAGAGAPGAGAPPRDAGFLLSLADESTRRNRHLDALSAIERAIMLDPAHARDPQIRAKIAKVLETRDLPAAMIALELLASRVEPPARDAVAKAAAASTREIRWRAFAIAERDGFADQIDRLESWSKDLRQSTTCDDRRAAIGKLRDLADKRAIPALKQARDGFPCVATEAGDAITQLQSQP